MPIIFTWLFGWPSKLDVRLKSSIVIYRAELELFNGKLKSIDGSNPTDAQSSKRGILNIIKGLFRRSSKRDGGPKNSHEICCSELELCVGKLKFMEGSGQTDAQVAEICCPLDARVAYVKACKLLDQAEREGKNDLELGWRLFKGAHRIGLYCLTQEQLQVQATAIYEEAKKKLDSWRKEAIVRILTDDCGKLKPCLKACEVFHAAYILDEYHNNEYHKLRAFKSQLKILAPVALGAAALWMGLSAFLIHAPIDAPIDVLKASGDLWYFVSVLLFGVMGAAISGFLSLSSGPTKHRIPEQLASHLVLLARLVIGGVSALVVYVFLISGILQLGPGDLKPGLVLAASFVAGFSERLVVRAVEAVGK
jgi:hypothetical protein